jgi:hypothetical protein
MIVHTLKQPFGHVIVENTFDEREYNNVWNELMFLQPKMRNGHDTGASQNMFGATNKNGFGIFLEDFFKFSNHSDIFLCTRKLISNFMISSVSNFDIYFQLFDRINTDTVLTQCYKNGDYYLPHKDSGLFTIVTLLHNTPKKYSGGEFVFPEYNYEVSLENNHSIIFPSMVLHEVKEVITESKNMQDFRYTISMFLQQNNSNNPTNTDKH